MSTVSCCYKGIPFFDKFVEAKFTDAADVNK